MSRIEVTDEQIKAAQAGDSDAMWEIVQAVDPMLKGLIRTVVPGVNTEDAEDYLQEARAVLIQHVRDYDSSSSAAQLTSFVYRAARRAIAEADVMSKTPLSIDPTAAIRVRRALWECGGDVEQAWATFRDAASPTKRMSRELFIAMVEALAGVECLDAPVRGGRVGESASADYTLADTIPDPSSQVTDPLERRDLARWLLTQIPKRQSLALRAYYGIGMTRMTDPDVCADMEINGAALRQLRSRGTYSARCVADAHDLVA